MLYFSRWKIYAIIGICLAGVLFSLPNLSGTFGFTLPSSIPVRTINLGLDLRGGSSLLLRVDRDAVVAKRLDILADTVRESFKKGNIKASVNPGPKDSLVVILKDPAQADAASQALHEMTRPTAGVPSDVTLDEAGDGHYTLALTEIGLRDRLSKAVDQSISVVTKRIDSTGVTEPSIVRRGDDRILIELPGESDPQHIKALLGTTAQMNFQMIDEGADPSSATVPAGDVVLPSAEGRDDERQYVVKKKVEVAGENLTDARAVVNSQNGDWVVTLQFDALGAHRFGDITSKNVGKRFAVVLDNKVLTAPVIRSAMTGGSGEISGNFTAQSAADLAVLLRAGALPVPLTVLEEHSVGPDLGADAVHAGLMSVALGIVLVLGYMVLAYGLFGVFADIAVIFNLFLTVAALSLLQATLTLPGIAGILLTLGMSVDANILINERIREETKHGRPPFSAMEAGFTRAFSTIVDSNLTTLIKMLILFQLGTGPVKGFAVTIILGIITSMFTATVVVRLIMVTWLRAKRRVALPV